MVNQPLVKFFIIFLNQKFDVRLIGNIEPPLKEKELKKYYFHN